MESQKILEQQCKALGQERRIRILVFLKKHRRGSVGEIAKNIHCSIPVVSQHLRVLREAGIIIDRRRGMRVLYVLSVHMSMVARTVVKAL